MPARSASARLSTICEAPVSMTKSIVAPFNYTTMLWALVFGYVFFGEIPLPIVLVGASIIAVAGLIVVFRERQLGKRDIDAPPPAP